MIPAIGSTAMRNTDHSTQETTPREVKFTPAALERLRKLSPHDDEISQIMDALSGTSLGSIQDHELFDEYSYIATRYGLGRHFWLRVGRFGVVYTSNGTIIVVTFHELG